MAWHERVNSSIHYERSKQPSNLAAYGLIPKKEWQQHCLATHVLICGGRVQEFGTYAQIIARLLKKPSTLGCSIFSRPE